MSDLNMKKVNGQWVQDKAPAKREEATPLDLDDLIAMAAVAMDILGPILPNIEPELKPSVRRLEKK